MARILNKDPATYEREKESFLRELQQFHETRGTPSRKPPKINGHEIDLYLLYAVVTSRGGWVKVNSRNEWDKVLEDFSFPKHCVNSTVALKQIYLRYLDRYEKVHYLGEIGERAGDDDEDSRHRRWSARALHSVPLTYNHAQHNVNESLREYNGLSVDLYKPSEYEKLALSLISPLPNEQDFAINVCTLLSNEGKHTLKLEKHRKLLHFLLAHAAVFSHSDLKVLFTESYTKGRGYSLTNFWPDVLVEPSFSRLVDESLFSSNRAAGCDSSVHLSDSFLCSKQKLKVEPEDNELFCLGRTLGSQEYVGQRVAQIAAILRNLSFLQDNVGILAKDLTFLRFVLLCCGSQWNNLSQIGWDILGNIAPEINSHSPLIDDILGITTRGLLSEDRAVILSSLEVLNKLGQNENNEDALLRFLEHPIYERVISFLTLHDIMLLVYTLECLNSISSLGERACNSIIRVRGALDTLVSLVTVEAQSYGQKACIQMRVVETLTGTPAPISSTSNPTSTTINSSSSYVPPSPSSSSVTSVAQTSQSIQPTSNIQTTPVATSSAPAPSSVQVVSTTASTINTPTAVLQTTRGKGIRVVELGAPSKANGLVIQPVASPTTPSHATQQVAQENEQFALAWLRNNFEPAPAGRVEQAELYKQYINHCANVGRRGVIAPLHFPRCVRSVFGVAVGPKPLSSTENAQHVYEGIQVRAKPLIVQTPTSQPHPASSNSVQTTPSPILKAQLSAPPKPTPVSTSQSKVTQRQQKLQQQQMQQLQSISLLASSLQGLNSSNSEMTSLAKISNCRVNGVRASSVSEIKIENVKEATNDSEVTSTSTIENHTSKPPPPLAPLSSSWKESETKTAVNMILNDETDSTGNSVASSSGVRDNLSTTGGEEGDSMSSLDGFVINGVPNSLEVEDTSSKDSAPKSMMLADLLEKNIEQKEPPVLNGSLRIGDKGLELVQGNTELKTSKSTEPVPPNGKVPVELNGSGKTAESLKRLAEEDKSSEPPAKKPHMNGDVRTEDSAEEMNVSSTAANLYAALAADALEDEPLEELTQQVQQTPQQQQPPMLVAASGQPRQILVAGQLAQRVVVGGQHYVVAQPQTALVQGQTQTVLVAQTPQQQGTGAKTIIILQPQGVSGTGSQKVIVQRLQSPPPPLHPTSQASNLPIRPSTPPKPSSTPPLVGQASKQTQKIIKAAVTSTATIVQNSAPVLPSMPVLAAPCAIPVNVNSVSPSVSSLQAKETKPVVIAKPSSDQQGHFLCEWRGCMRNFKSGNEVYLHACEAHCPQGSQEIQCLWERCDAMKRKRLSLMTHLYDRHCNADVMRMMAVRRKQLSVSGRSEIPAPQPPTPHPGYAPNAAFHAIKRHALEFLNPKELQDDNEGPVTKSIRLTAALILRNLVIYSTNGRRYLIRYEPHLASVALSNVESSRTVAQLLFDMSQPR